MKMPRLNMDAFEESLKLLNQEADSADIKTRSEVRLEAAQDELARLDEDTADAQQAIAKTKQAIAGLSQLLRQQEANEVDIAIERNATIQLIHALTEGGIRSRKNG